MGDTELELSPAHQQEALQKSPSASSLSLSTSSSLSLPSSPSSGPSALPASPSISASGSASDGGPPLTSSSSPSLDVITEGVGELTVVIDPEVAKLACQEVLQKVMLQKGELEVAEVTAAAATERPALANGAATHVRDAPVSLVPVKPGRKVGGGEDEEPEQAMASPSSGSSGKSSVRRRQKQQQHNNSSKQSWLLRLFESKLFDVSMAISYLYNSKEPGVQAYIGNRLFSFPYEDVDFYLPQLLNMYIHMDEDVGDAIKPYVVHRCRQSISFSLGCAWLLGAYSSDMHISTQRHSRGTKLRKLILSDELKPAGPRLRPPVPYPPPSVAAALHHEHGLSPTKRTHQRSKSDATVSISLSSNLKRTASNPKVEANQDEVCQVYTHTLPVYCGIKPMCYVIRRFSCC